MNCLCFPPHLSSVFHHLMLFLSHRDHSYTATQCSTRIQNPVVNEFCSTLEKNSDSSAQQGWTEHHRLEGLSTSLWCCSTLHVYSVHPFVSPAILNMLYCASHSIIEIWSPCLTKWVSLDFTASEYCGRASEAEVSHGKQAWSQNHFVISGLCSQLAVICLQQYFCSFWAGSTVVFT